MEEQPEVLIEQLSKLAGSAPCSRHTLLSQSSSSKPQPTVSRKTGFVSLTQALPHSGISGFSFPVLSDCHRLRMILEATRLRVHFPRVASEMLTKHMDMVFEALQHMDGSVLRGLGERLRASDVLWPCESPTGDGECLLFPWMHTALDPKQSSSLICPVAGKIRGRAAREVARILGAPKVPNPNVLLKFLPET